MDVSPTNPQQAVYYNTVSPGGVVPKPSSTANTGTTTYQDLTEELWGVVRTKLSETEAEVIQRNERVAENDAYVYGNKIETSLDVPIGHDFTPVNWLKRVVEIHKTQFMGRPFQVVASYHVKDVDNSNPLQPQSGMAQYYGMADDSQKAQIENKKQKTAAQLRMNTVKDIIRDNGGHSLFMDGAESASVTGAWIIKAWYDEDEKKYILSPVETIENCYAVWSHDDFRQYDLFGYVYQISKLRAIQEYNVPEDVATSPVGTPLAIVASVTPLVTIESQPMVSIIEATGKIDGWTSKDGRVRKCAPGEETEMNLTFVGNKLVKVIDRKNRLPKYYIFPNKKARRRAWGLPDITKGAIMLNLAYIEALSDWRTVASKVNFPKFKLFKFGPGATLPKFQSRAIQSIALGAGQDIQNIPMGDGGSVDFRAQLLEIKEQFSRETATAAILLDNDGQSNSNQALITSMKPTTDVAEIKKELWGPILAQMFSDALDTLAAFEPETYGDLADQSDPWYFKVQWPSMIQKEDPVYQQMLLNRWNAGTISLQSFLEAENESYEEIDRIREEMTDQITAAIHGRMLGPLFSLHFMPPPSQMPPKVNVNLRGDLDPGQVGDLAYDRGFNGGQNEPNAPFQTSAGPVGYAGEKANDAVMNQGMINGQQTPAPTGVERGPNGQVVSTQANNQPGQGVMSQPGSGAPAVTPQGAVNQQAQNQGR